MSPLGQGGGACLSTHLVYIELTCHVKGSRRHARGMDRALRHFASTHGQTAAGFKLGPTYNHIETRHTSRGPGEFQAKQSMAKRPRASN